MSETGDVFIDTCILLDVLTHDSKWFAWSSEVLEGVPDESRILINVIVYAELSARFARMEELDKVLREGGVKILDIPRQAAFLAAKAHLAYRRRGGVRKSVLPDFFIGAHAAVMGCHLVTRDTHRFRTYFPKLHLVHP